MRIAISTGAYYPMTSGVAVFSHNLALGLAARGHEVMVLCPSQTGEAHVEMDHGVKTAYLKSTKVMIYPDQVNPLPPQKQIFGKKLPHLFYRNGFRISVFPEKNVNELLAEFRPDVLHVQVSDLIGISAVAYARKHNIPVVTTAHNLPDVFTGPLHVPSAVKKPIDNLLAAYFVNRQGKGDYVTMPTRMAIDELLGDRDFDVPVEAVSNGVDLSNFTPGKASDGLHRKYKIEKDVPTILYIGRVDPEKNVGLVIDAFFETLKKVPNAQLVVVGDGVDKPRLMKKAAGQKKVHFTGRVMPPELYEMYRLGDVFVTASTIETQGIVLIEAAASGLPLVAVSSGAVPEVCRNDKNGFLCEPGNVAEISEAIVKILADKELRKKFSQKSLEIAKGHDFEKTLDKYIGIYTKLIADKNKPE